MFVNDADNSSTKSDESSFLMVKRSHSKMRPCTMQRAVDEAIDRTSHFFSNPRTLRTEVLEDCTRGIALPGHVHRLHSEALSGKSRCRAEITPATYVQRTRSLLRVLRVDRHIGKEAQDDA